MYEINKVPNDVVRLECLIRQTSYAQRKFNTACLIAMVVIVTSVLLLGLVYFLVSAKTENSVAETALTSDRKLMADPQYRELSMLHAELSAILMGSLEAKLSTLENRLHENRIDASDLAVLEEVKRDLRFVKNSSYEHSMNMLGWTREAATQSETKAALKTALIDEVAHLKSLIYIGMASFSVLAFVMIGLWLQSIYRIRLLDGKLMQLQSLPHPADSDSL